MSSPKWGACSNERNNAWGSWTQPASIPWKLQPPISMVWRLILLCYESDFPLRSPKLNPGPIAQPYITSTAGIARADRNRLVNDKDRQIAACRVEGPVKVKTRIKNVGNLACLPFFRLWRKYISKISWRRITSPVLGTRSALLIVLS